MSNFKYVGKSLPRHDVLEKATGKIKYVGDMKIDGMLYARLVLSEVGHGKIKNIDTSKAESLPGVVGVFTHKNTPNRKYNSHQWMVGLKEIEDQRLFSDKARYHGDRIAAVVAKDEKTAIKAAELVEVEYEELPAVIDPEESIKEETIKIHEKGNNPFNKTVKCGNSEEAFKDAEYIFEDKVRTPKQHHAAMEPHICLAEPDSAGNITIWTPCQVVFQVQLIVSKATGISKKKIRVIKAPMGGSFGGKGQPTLEPVCAYLANELQAPVRLATDRSQSVIGTRTRHKTVGKVKTAVNTEGKIIAREVDIIGDTGAYYTNGTAFVMAMAKKLFRLYRIKDQTYKGRSVYTNTPIGGACRGYGSPQIHAVTEINLSNIARKMNWDPVKFRLKNLVHPFDEDGIGGPNLGNARAIECVEKGAEKFNWKQKWNREKDEGRYIRGIGMACATHGNGYRGAYPDFMNITLRINEDGEAILNSAIHDLGCGTVTTMKQIVAEVIDLHPDSIRAPEGDTLLSPYDSAGTQASRVTYVCGGAAKKVAEMLKDKIINYASKLFECSIEDIDLQDGYVVNQNNSKQKITYRELAQKVQLEFEDDLTVSHTYKSPANPGVYAANFVEVKVDTYTGLVEILDFVASHDVGQAINTGFVEGQIQGGAHMSLGYGLMEEFKINKKGIIKSQNFSKYHIINAPDMPEVKVVLVEDGEETGPFGAKSVGEICAVAAAPAIVNAINNALDTYITTLPATPERIIETLKEKRN